MESIIMLQEPARTHVLWQMNPVHTFQPYLFKICLNIIFPSMPRPLKWTLLSDFPTKILTAVFFSIMRAMYPAHHILLHSIGEE